VADIVTVSMGVQGENLFNAGVDLSPPAGGAGGTFALGALFHATREFKGSLGNCQRYLHEFLAENEENLKNALAKSGSAIGHHF
jgi:hypothetical protein